MATITARGKLIVHLENNVTNPENVTDSSDTTYGTISLSGSSSKDIVIGGFDFSTIPNGATINSFSLKSLVGLDSNVSCIMYATRHYDNGTFNNVGVTSNKSFGSAGTLIENSISETSPFTVFAGFTAESINRKWTGKSDYSGIAFYIRYRNSSLISRKAYPRYFDLTVDFTLPTVILTTEASPPEGGTVTGGGVYDSGSTATVTATPKSGYAFSHWLVNGLVTSEEATIQFTLTANATVTAVFVPVPVYVSYDSILNYQKWKELITANNGVVSNITDTGFTLTSNDGVNEGTATSPYFPVEHGKSYIIDVDTSEGAWDIYIFFCNDSGEWIDFADGPSNRFSNNTNWGNTFTAPNKAEVVKAQIRVDANGSNNTVRFENIRVYEEGAVADGVSYVPSEKVAYGSQWDIPTPKRDGYEFIGWNTKPDGTGVTYKNDSAFPTNDLILYSQWSVISKIYYGSNTAKSVFDTNKNKAKSVWYGKTQIL